MKWFAAWLLAGIAAGAGAQQTDGRTPAERLAELERAGAGISTELPGRRSPGSDPALNTGCIGGDGSITLLGVTSAPGPGAGGTTRRLAPANPVIVELARIDQQLARLHELETRKSAFNAWATAFELPIEVFNQRAGQPDPEILDLVRLRAQLAPVLAQRAAVVQLALQEAAKCP